MDLKEGGLHIWRYTLDENDYHLEKSAPLLSVGEKERCCRYLREAEQIRYTCNHRFVRQVLSKYMGLPAAQISFGQTAMGKPFVMNSGLFFNYSYRTTLGLLAVARHAEVGVDIEKMKILRDPQTFAGFSFSEKEKDIIFSSSPASFQDTLFTFWTFKEAVIKALGVGLNADLTKIDLSDFFHRELNPLNADELAIYTVKQIRATAGYKAAFAIKGELRDYAEFDYIGN